VGPLPTGIINAALGTELEPADVWVSKKAHEHMALDHPNDYDAIKSNIIDIIRSPTYAGQDPKQGENFYLVSRVERINGLEPLLIAIGLEQSVHGTYNVKTGYAINENDVATRRLRGSLHQLI
jgi:phage-Barnase-EndoU-ColicinE5/D-RelE like nuclease3